MALLHGGQLQQMATRYQVPVDEWLDLSTGIAPLSYPIPAVPLHYWQQLPQLAPHLNLAARDYYQCQNILVTNGSQSIIKALPNLWRQYNQQSNKVYLPAKGYKEHEHAWASAGYNICYYHDELPAKTDLSEHCVLVVINPNNPTGKLFTQTEICQYQKTIKEINGLMVVDEAFMDVIEPDQSITSFVNNTDHHTLVLRSFGKFFGLAGIRIGFLITSDYWQRAFSEHLGPWQVNGPAQYIAELALKDKIWQQQQRENLHQLRLQQEALLRDVLGSEIIAEVVSTNLFITLSFNQLVIAKLLHELLCKLGIYVRLTDEQTSLRFGITTKANFPRLVDALLQAKIQLKK
ncbi:threonine-phosphate decarboxylase CobD [Thalassotalea profundi]|uniref:threonine-phosphate decarboxylase n=1 Tax=Thalassotalea profundi TaxID=2036687 RepID=A0ABQ3IMS3_9GAMM|nr:threonine-phosphate decarboxylase CobD [Thalassotalea profundi]GHE89007.1 threonine-phosphate decarboxylase [Thalassotalea profundi]